MCETTYWIWYLAAKQFVYCRNLQTIQIIRCATVNYCQSIWGLFDFHSSWVCWWMFTRNAFLLSLFFMSLFLLSSFFFIRKRLGKYLSRGAIQRWNTDAWLHTMTCFSATSCHMHRSYGWRAYSISPKRKHQQRKSDARNFFFVTLSWIAAYQVRVPHCWNIERFYNKYHYETVCWWLKHHIMRKFQAIAIA